jgi:pimeloyl-ACP methyl ester carboxylesterase
MIYGLPAASLLSVLLVNGSAAPAETMTVDGHEVAFAVHGALDSPEIPVLLLHGGMMTIDLTFAGFLPVLSATHPVIGVEQQGHARTADREAPITLKAMRADTIGVLDHLGVERVHVVGFSMGGMLGLDLALNAPERIASLTAISISQNFEAMHPEIRRMNTDPDYQPSPEVVALLPSEDDFAAMRATYAAQNPSGPAAFETVLGKLHDFITGEWGWSDAELASIAAPVLMVTGDRDFSSAENVAAMAAAIPGAWLAVLPDTTHMDIITRTETLLPMIEARIAASENP